MNWKARWYTPADDEQLFNLVRSDLSPNRTRDEWAWAFKGNPVQLPTAVAEAEDGSIVGQYTVSAIPCGVMKAAVSVDTVVRKDFHRRGIFVTLAEMVYAKLIEHGYKAVITYPGYHRNSTPGLLKLGFQRICPVLCATGNVSHFHHNNAYRPWVHFEIDFGPWTSWRISRPGRQYVLTQANSEISTTFEFFSITETAVVLIYSDVSYVSKIYESAQRLARIYQRERFTFYGAAHDPLMQQMIADGFDVGPAGYDFMVRPLASGLNMLKKENWLPQAGWWDVF